MRMACCLSRGSLWVTALHSEWPLVLAVLAHEPIHSFDEASRACRKNPLKLAPCTFTVEENDKNCISWNFLNFFLSLFFIFYRQWKEYFYRLIECMQIEYVMDKLFMWSIYWLVSFDSAMLFQKEKNKQIKILTRRGFFFSFLSACELISLEYRFKRSFSSMWPIFFSLS